MINTTSDRPHRRRLARTGLFIAATTLTAAWLVTPAFAQDGRPGPAAPQPQAQPADETPAEGDPPTALDPSEWSRVRRALQGGKVPLAFDDVGVRDLLPFIAEATGKVVMPVNLAALQNRKITLVNDEPIEQADALDLLFQAFRVNQVGVIERDDVVIVGMIDELVQMRLLPVLTAEDDIRYRKDKGSLVVKLFQLTEVPAEEVFEKVSEGLPSYATVNVDPNSNQIVVVGDIGLCQHLETIIEELDNTYLEPRTATFRLAYADATDVSENILDLFESSGTSGGGAQRTQTTRRPTRTTGRQAQATPGGSVVGPEIELRVTVNAQQNSVTVTGEPRIVDDIASLIEEEWDLPRSPGTSKIYDLTYTDPLKVAEKLNSLLGQGGSGGGRTGGARGAAGSGGGGSVDQILQGIYRIEAYPDTSQLLVFCKTEASLDFLDTVISQLDQPSVIGLPFVVELHHANAIELAEELNALLSEAGAGVTIARPGEGLSGRDEESGAAGTDSGADAGQLQFPWQRGGRQREDVSPESSLIGKVRIVPILRQNALAVLCPSPQRDAVRQLIEDFDMAGRQVMISAVIAEVELNDELSLGLRLSSSDDILGGANPDFRLGGSGTFDMTEDNIFGSLFDTSLLTAGFNVNVALQALAQVTNVRILQEPVIFTADNQEALFFDGQEIPFITNTTINSAGNANDSFEYREVGVTLNVRPRITVEKDVDIEVLLELSSVVPGVTIFGAAVLDKRESRTNIVVRDGQTVVISGILRDEVSKITRKIPLLGDIPLIGELFKSRENSTVTTELIAFITPQVVDHTDGEADFQREFRDRLEDLSQPVDDKPINRREMLDHPDEFRSRGWMTPKLTLPETPGEDEGVSPGAKKDRNDPFKVYR
ncbi:MAG: hypothetical protein HKN62_16060 [Phycisphaerales bacterium]|nr:hypothetical protein [Phycisphaerales bacterium]